MAKNFSGANKERLEWWQNPKAKFDFSPEQSKELFGVYLASPLSKEDAFLAFNKFQEYKNNYNG